MPKRRGHHEGMIRKRIDGRWEARLSLPDGRTKSYYGKTQAEAREKLRTAQRRLDQGMNLRTDRVTVGEFLDRWLAEVVKSSIRPSTFASYAGHVKNHLTPALGRRKLTELTPSHVQTLMNEKLAVGLSPRTVQYMRAVLRRALGQAMKWGLVTRNVASLVDPPRSKKKPVHPLAADQVRTLLGATKEDRLGTLIHVAIATGLRQGELFGLRWEDVDLDAGTLTVRYAMQRVKQDGAEKSAAVFIEPKTDKSRRTITLPASAVAALRSHSIRQMEDRLLAGGRWQGGTWNLVFASTIGTPLNPSNVTHRFQRLLADAGLPRQRFHDLRHCSASLLLAQGIPARTIMERLGHSQISLTLNTYAHLSPALERDAANALDAALATGS